MSKYITNSGGFKKIAYQVGEFCALTGIGRTTLYSEVQSGLLDVVKVGRRTLICHEDAVKWLAKRKLKMKTLQIKRRRR